MGFNSAFKGLNKSFTVTAFIPTHARIYTLKHQFTLILKTLKSILKNILVRLPLHVSVHIYDHLQGAREQYFVQLLS
jgi:hypothetical protein